MWRVPYVKIWVIVQDWRYSAWENNVFLEMQNSEALHQYFGLGIVIATS